MIRANVTTGSLKVLYREFKYNILVGQRAINLGKSFQLGLHVDKVFRVKIYFQCLGTVDLISNAFANNLRRVHNVLNFKQLKSKLK